MALLVILSLERKLMVIFHTSGSGATDKPKVYVLDCVNGWIKT